MYLNKSIILSSSESILNSTLREILVLILLQLRFLNLSGYFTKATTIYPQYLILHYIMHLFTHILPTAI